MQPPVRLEPRPTLRLAAPIFLVTGALGCIGAWTVERLLAAGAKTVAFDLGDDPRRIRDLVGEEGLARVSFVQGDIADPESLRRAIEDHAVTHVIHLAGLQVPFCRADPMLGARVNVLGTVNVFEEAAWAGIGRLSYASSAAVYERNDEVIAPGSLDEDRAPHPNTHYGVFKLACEGIARISHMEHGTSSVGLRPLTVYGVGRDQGMTSGPTKAIKAAVAGRPYTIGFSGDTDFLFARDCAEAFIRGAMEGPDGAEVFNLAGSSHPVAHFVEILSSVAPEAADLVSVEGPELPVPGAIDGARIDALLPGLPRTDLAAGIRATFDHFSALAARGDLSLDDLSS